MSRVSLQLRLLVAGLAAMLAALALAGFALTLLFERHVERRAIAEAETHLRTLIAGATVAPGARLVLDSLPADPRFAEAYSGLYWQVQPPGGALMRSRSLWDAELPLPADDLGHGGGHVHTLSGPRKATLLAVERAVLLTSEGSAQTYRMVVAIDRKEIVQARNAFLRDLVMALGLLALALAVAFVAQIRVGLSPLKAVQLSLSRIRSGLQPRLPPDFPSEVTPLATEINTLLDERDAAIERARGRAADLAHGLKTPLTALNANVRRLREAGQAQTADEIEALGAMMQRHVQRELARARLAGRNNRGAALRLRPIVEGVASAVACAPSSEGKAFDLDFEPDMTIEMDRADLEELLGNLIENATRHARSVVRIRAEATPHLLTLDVGDDGPGVSEKDRQKLLVRGARLDLSGNGAGLGFSIVSDVVSAYGGTFALGVSDLGGLSATLTLPLANSAPERTNAS